MTEQEIYNQLRKLSLFLAIGNMVWLVVGTAGVVLFFNTKAWGVQLSLFPYALGVVLFIGYWVYAGGIYFQKLLPGSLFLWGLTIIFNALLVLACLLIILWEARVIFPASLPLLWGMLSIKFTVDIIRYEYYILSHKYLTDPEDFGPVVGWE